MQTSLLAKHANVLFLTDAILRDTPKGDSICCNYQLLHRRVAVSVPSGYLQTNTEWTSGHPIKLASFFSPSCPLTFFFSEVVKLSKVSRKACSFVATVHCLSSVIVWISFHSSCTHAMLLLAIGSQLCPKSGDLDPSSQCIRVGTSCYRTMDSNRLALAREIRLHICSEVMKRIIWW